MASYVVGNAQWTALHRARTGLQSLTGSIRSSALSHVATSAQFFHLSDETPSMLEMKKMKYPSYSAEPSIFEEVANDYLSLPARAAGLPALAHVPHGIPDMPAVLIEEGRYGEADRVLAEMKEMGIQPRHSPIFMDAALRVIYGDFTSLPERQTAFRKWYSLIPGASSKYMVPTNDRRMTSIVDKLLQESIPDLGLLAEFALITVSKGYVTVPRKVVDQIVCLSHPTFSLQFMQSVYNNSTRALERVKHLHAAQCSPVEPVSYSPRFGLAQEEASHVRLLKACFIAAIIGYVRSGKVAVAVQLLQKARRWNVTIPPDVYIRVLRKTEDVLNMRLIKTLLIEEHGKMQPTPFPNRRSDHQQPSPVDLPDLSNSSNLATALQLLHRRMHSSDYPSPAVLASVIDACRSARRARILWILRKRSYKSMVTTQMWALAEMLVHRRNKEFKAIPVVFAHNFRLVGVPNQIRHHMLGSGSHEGEAKDVGKPSPYVLYLQHPSSHKLLPLPQHTALVWHAYAEAAEDIHALEKLYKELVDQMIASRDATSPPPSGAEPLENSLLLERLGAPYPDAIAPITMYDATHFNVFIRAFGKCSLPRAVQVVDDMIQLGIQPSRDTTGYLVFAFGRSAWSSEVLHLLDRLESKREVLPPAADDDAAVEHSGLLGEQSWMNQNVALPPPGVLPPPEALTYVVASQWLLRRKQYMKAWRAAVRIFTEANYEIGTDVLVDRHLVELATKLSEANSGALAHMTATVRRFVRDQPTPEKDGQEPEPSDLQSSDLKLASTSV